MHLVTVAIVKLAAGSGQRFKTFALVCTITEWLIRGKSASAERQRASQVRKSITLVVDQLYVIPIDNQGSIVAHLNRCHVELLTHFLHRGEKISIGLRLPHLVK